MGPAFKARALEAFQAWKENKLSLLRVRRSHGTEPPKQKRAKVNGYVPPRESTDDEELDGESGGDEEKTPRRALKKIHPEVLHLYLEERAIVRVEMVVAVGL